MFANKNTLYVVGYTVADEADFARLRELLDRHTNALFKVMETQSVLKEFKHERVIRVPLCDPAISLHTPDKSFLDRRDSECALVINKRSSMQDVLYALDICTRYNLESICMVSIYALSGDQSGLLRVDKGTDWETYKHLQLQ